MKFHLISILTTSLLLALGDCTCEKVDAKFSDSEYYAGAYNCLSLKDVECLRSELSKIVSEATSHSYSCVWDIIKYSDEDVSNKDNVILFYTKESRKKSDQQDSSSPVDKWNREHVWLKSRGFPDESDPGFTDAHHIRPCYSELNNNVRGEKDFKNGGEAVCLLPYRGDPSDCEVLSYMSSNTFEVPDFHKGDVARMMFYMMIRYPRLTLTNCVTSNQCKSNEHGWLDDLLQWASIDNVDNMERRRNDRVFEYQGNRNPFIDHPEWLEYIFISKEIPDQLDLSPAAIVSIVAVAIIVVIVVFGVIYFGRKNRAPQPVLLD